MEKLKKYDNLILWIFIAIICTTIIFQVEVGTEDELWNFNNIYKMVNGFTIYKDANVIITPIFFLIGQLIFKIFGANFFIYRLFNICIHATLMLIIYCIFKKLDIGKRKSFLYTLIVYYFFYNLVAGGANYNVLAILFVFIGIYMSLKYDITKNKFIILNSVIIYFTFFTKQNIGVYYAIRKFCNANIVKSYRK